MRFARGAIVLVTLALASLGPAAWGDPASRGPAIRDAWARATPPGVSVAAVYLTIVGGPKADRVTSARTDRAGMTHLHSATRKDGVAQMRPVDALPVAAGARVVFAPEGLHLMLMDLARPLRAGERFDVTLVFEHGGPVTAPVTVIAPDAAPPAPAPASR